MELDVGDGSSGCKSGDYVAYDLAGDRNFKTYVELACGLLKPLTTSFGNQLTVLANGANGGDGGFRARYTAVPKP